MADDSLTARNRINQRNFRARRQNYIKELEERLRKYESDGIQATIEIQAAARQVTDQNIKLRSLLIHRFGMSDQEISNYLGMQHPSPQSSQQPFANTFPGAPHLSNLGPASVQGLAPKPLLPADAQSSYPTPPQQSDPPRLLPSTHLDPALSLASLRTFGPRNHEQLSPSGPTASQRLPNISANQIRGTEASPNHIPPPASPTDTLSESSHPSTPADHNLADHPRPAQARSKFDCGPAKDEALQQSTSDEPSRLKANDETSCEEAARIIASMRGGGGGPEEVLLELGCVNDKPTCKVKTLNVFQLMDRG